MTMAGLGQAVFVPVFRSGVEIQIGCKGVACTGLFGRLIRAVRGCSNMQAFTKALFFFRRGQKSHRSFCKAQDIENS